MFRQLRRSKQALSRERIIKVLETNTAGVLSLHGDDGYTYGVPLNYVFVENKIYFHSGEKGYKIEAVKSNPRVSFTIIDQDILASELYTSLFRSVIVFGKIRIVADEKEKLAAIKFFTKKLAPDDVQKRLEGDNMQKYLKGLVMLALDIEETSGKQSSKIKEND